MASTYTILGSADLATTLSTVVTVATATSVVISTICIANRSATPTSFRLAICAAGGAPGNGEYIAYDTPIGGNESIFLTHLGLTMGATDEVQALAAIASVALNVFGVKIT